MTKVDDPRKKELTKSNKCFIMTITNVCSWTKIAVKGKERGKTGAGPLREEREWMQRKWTK